MKLLHLSDLHVGKRVHEANLLEDQAYILQKILEIVDAEAPDAVLLAGDLYDRTTPSAEAVALFDEFLCRLAARPTRVLAISGNHDSPERVAFASRLLTARDVYLSPVFDGTILSAMCPWKPWISAWPSWRCIPSVKPPGQRTWST